MSWSRYPYMPYSAHGLYPMSFHEDMTGLDPVFVGGLRPFPVTEFPGIMGHRVLVNESRWPVHVRSSNGHLGVPPGRSMVLRRIAGLSDSVNVFARGVWSSVSLDSGDARCGPGGFSKTNVRGHKICSFPSSGIEIVFEGRFVKIRDLGRRMRKHRHKHRKRHGHNSPKDDGDTSEEDDELVAGCRLNALY